MTFDIVTPKRRDLGGFFVQRLLPSHPHRTVGPFFDHLGQIVMAAGHGTVSASARRDRIDSAASLKRHSPSGHRLRRFRR